MEKATKAFDSIKSKVSRTLIMPNSDNLTHFLKDFIEKYELNDETKQIKITFAILAGATAVILLKKALTESKLANSPGRKNQRSSQRSNKNKKSEIKGEINLSLEESEFRKSVISEMNYNLVFFIDPQGSKTFDGMANLRFILDKQKLLKGKPLFLDYQGQRITKLRINGQDVKSISKCWNNNSRLELDSELLKDGLNNVEVYFTNEFSQDGGLILVKDSEGQQYVYTDTKPFSSNKIYPCFDQPSIKAQTKLLLVTPQGWNVVSNDTPVQIDDISSGFTADMTEHLKKTLGELNTNWELSAFDNLERLKTSSFGFVAGKFESILLDDKSHNLPNLAIHARPGLAKQLRAESEDLFMILVNALEYLKNLFGRNPSAPKIDLFFLPGVPEQGVSLSGCCVLDEEFLNLYEADVMGHTERAVEIAQQLVYGWIGHSITTEWCNDSWIDEGLSLFLGHLTLTKICRSLEGKLGKGNQLVEKNIWSHFIYNKGMSLIDSDIQLNYPISLDINNMAEYEALDLRGHRWRSAAVWRQLYLLIGEESFKRGVKKCASDYDSGFINKERLVKIFDQILKARHETPMGDSLDNFVMTTTFDISTFEISDWIRDWVDTSGLNNLEIIWDKNNAMFSNLIKIKQTAEGEGAKTLRNHRLKVAFFDYQGQIFKLKDVLVSGQEQSNLILEDPNRVPHALLLDSEGNSFFNSRIEPGSESFFLNNLHNITDEFVISTVLQRTAYMVTIGALSSLDFIKLVGRLVGNKGDTISPILLQEALNFAHYIVSEFTPEENKTELKTILYEASIKLLRRGHYDTTSCQIIGNEIWKFLARKDQVREVLVLIREILQNSVETISLENIYEIFKACYKIDKDDKYYNEFIQLVNAAGFRNSAVEVYSNWLQRVINQDPEHELSLFKQEQKRAGDFEGLKVVLTSVGAQNYLKRILDVIEEKASRWSSRKLRSVLDFVWDLTRDAERLESILAQVSKLNIKNNKVVIQTWVKSKTAQLHKINIAYSKMA